MRILPTSAPTAKMDGERVIATIHSGPTTLEIELSPHEAMRLSEGLRRAAVSPIEACRPMAEVVSFTAPAAGRA